MSISYAVTKSGESYHASTGNDETLCGRLVESYIFSVPDSLKDEAELKENEKFSSEIWDHMCKRCIKSPKWD